MLHVVDTHLIVTGTAIANGYFVGNYTIDDRRDLRAPANRKRTFAVLSRRAPVVQFSEAVATAKAKVAAKMRFMWLGDVIMLKEDLTRSVYDSWWRDTPPPSPRYTPLHTPYIQQSGRTVERRPAEIHRRAGANPQVDGTCRI